MESYQWVYFSGCAALESRNNATKLLCFVPPLQIHFITSALWYKRAALPGVENILNIVSQNDQKHQKAADVPPNGILKVS